MGLPFVILRPLPRRDQDGELVEPRRDAALEAQIIAHRLGAQHHLRTAQHDRERPAHGITPAGREFGGRLLLGIAQLVCRDFRHALLRHGVGKPP
jgi:hypothetical protein